MPRETIDGVAVLVGEQVAPPFTVQVGWDTVGSVQIGVETPNRLDVFWLLTGMSIHDTADAEELEKRAARIGGWLRAAFEKCGVQLVPDPERIDGEITDGGLARLVVNTLGDATHHPSSLWADLDRHRLNRLIVLLRKARDAAFGKDQ